MKFYSFIFLMLLLSIQTLAQLTREELIRNFESDERVEIKWIDEDLREIIFQNGKSNIKNLGNFRKIGSVGYLDSTIIDLNNLDTTTYWNKYLLWKEISICSYDNRPVIGDLNNNGFNEIYGFHKEFDTDYSDVIVRELNSLGEFDSLHSYDTTSTPIGIHDINSNGKDNLILNRRKVDTTTHALTSYELHFEQSSEHSLADSLMFIFAPYNRNSQRDDNTYGLFDDDEKTDLVFIRHIGHFGVYEYEEQINNFDFRYDLHLSPFDVGFQGISVGDFDQDGLTEFVMSSLHGKVLIVENRENDYYELSWQGSVETFNAYMHVAFDDLDGNGKPEFWVGGDAFYNGVPITRITCFETVGDNDYQAIAKIDIIGAFSFYGYRMDKFDVDNDGTEELFILVMGHVMLLKFNGSPDHHTFEIFYLNVSDYWGYNHVIHTAGMYDLTNSGREEIIIHQDHMEEGEIRFLTLLYKANFPLDVEKDPEPVPAEFKLNQNYPNPFNPSTTIRFAMPQEAKVNIMVYNILGKEIIQLINETRISGKYEVTWNGIDDKGKAVPSGIYFIAMYADKYSKTIKSVLIK